MWGRFGILRLLLSLAALTDAYPGLRCVSSGLRAKKSSPTSSGPVTSWSCDILVNDIAQLRQRERMPNNKLIKIDGPAMKATIVQQLGETEVLLPARIAEGLAANGRAKARLAALQAVAKQATHPAEAPEDLSAECAGAGLDAAAIGAMTAAARAMSPGRITAPGLAKLVRSLFDDVGAMVAAVTAGDEAAGQAAANRLTALQARLPAESDEVEVGRITELAALPAGADSLHRLVMDLHKALNRLSAACAEEDVAGARAHSLLPEDRPLIAAFMRGLDRTRHLKFDHPGLDTTAARADSRLVIQNDIGATDAHVLVVAVEAMKVTVTYTDIHRARARFFVALFDRFPVEWSGLGQRRAKGLAEGDTFYLVSGRYEADSEKSREAFLEAIGMSVVFLIDWNKARKSLRNLVDGQSATRLLDWAARHRVGHRAYLEYGGSDLVAAAIRHAAPTRIGFGEQLAAVLGYDIAVDFLKAVLRIATEGLQHGRSSRLVRDMIETELVRHLDRTDRAMLAIVIRQLGLAHDIAVNIASEIADRPMAPAIRGGGREESSLALRARRIEEKADRIAEDARAIAERTNASAVIAQLIDTAEQTVDELEQAAFVASLAPPVIDKKFLAPLTELADAAVRGAEAAASGIDAATEVGEGRRADVDDAFDATRRLIDFEHAADDAERRITGLVLGSGAGNGGVLILELARAIERSTDRLAHVGHLLREHVIADLAA
jgi:uncharacterized protein Yka (UPF0111/DUF47 family)